MKYIWSKTTTLDTPLVTQIRHTLSEKLFYCQKFCYQGKIFTLGKDNMDFTYFSLFSVRMTRRPKFDEKIIGSLMDRHKISLTLR